MGTVAMEKENTTYSYSISVFKNIEELKIRDEKYTLFWTLPAPWKNMALSICNGNSAPRLKTSTITYQEAWERLQSLIDTYHNIVDILKSI